MLKSKLIGAKVNVCDQSIIIQRTLGNYVYSILSVSGLSIAALNADQMDMYLRITGSFHRRK